LREKWQPAESETEKGFENPLYALLHEKLPDVQITKQYAVGRVKADLLN
jgi:hypothetical protein